MKPLSLALCQMTVTDSKEANLRKAEAMVRRAAGAGADMAVLPEMFSCPYDNAWFPRFAEPEDGPSVERLSKLARETGLYLIGGSIPESAEDPSGETRLYNTSFSFDPAGKLIGKHRKIHLFDIDVKGGVKFRESDTLSPGKTPTLLETPWGRIGVAICFDIRFPELFRTMTLAGAWLAVVPAAFNMTTGPAHWELSFRMRAVDNQFFTAGAAPARDEKAGYVSYGNSLISDPWGRILGRLEGEEDLLIRELDPALTVSIREQLPLLSTLEKKRREAEGAGDR